MLNLIGGITICLAQGGVDFEIELPQYFGAFTESASASYIARSDDPVAAIQVSRFEIDSGVFLESFLDDVKKRQWLPMRDYPNFNLQEWDGKVSGMVGGGFEIKFQDSIFLQRIALHGTSLILLSWESPIELAADGRDCLDSFVAPSDWFANHLPVTDMYMGDGAKGLASAYPGHLVVSVAMGDLKENQTLEFTVGFAPTDDAPKFKWQLPSFAINVIKNNDYSVSYQLHLGAPQQSNDSLGIFRFSDNDLMAFDPLWLATPVFEDEQHYLPPRWQLNLRYAPYLVAVSAPMLKVELDDATGLKTSLTQAVPAGKCWPFFAVANYRSLSTNDFKWFLRLDSKSKLPEEMVTQLLELNQQLDKLLGPQISEFTIASFPYSNDRSFPGLLVFDEQRNWFDSPTDNFLDGFSRRTHLARYLCEYRFGVECRGLGTASLFLTRSLAEFLSYLLLTESGLEKDAEKLQQHWRLKEQQHPKLAQALSLLTINDLYGPRRLLSFGALVWNDIFDKLGRKQFLSLCRKIYQQQAYSAKDLQAMLIEISPQHDWPSYFKKHIFGNLLPGDK